MIFHCFSYFFLWFSSARIHAFCGVFGCVFGQCWYCILFVCNDVCWAYDKLKSLLVSVQCDLSFCHSFHFCSHSLCCEFVHVCFASCSVFGMAMHERRTHYSEPQCIPRCCIRYKTPKLLPPFPHLHVFSIVVLL